MAIQRKAANRAQKAHAAIATAFVALMSRVRFHEQQQAPGLLFCSGSRVPECARDDGLYVCLPLTVWMMLDDICRRLRRKEREPVHSRHHMTHQALNSTCDDVQAGLFWCGCCGLLLTMDNHCGSLYHKPCCTRPYVQVRAA